jgi:putative CocE/NonD family hydrolase
LYEAIRDRAASAAAREGQALLMGPWAHLLPYSIPTSRGTGDIDFGPEAEIDLLGMELAWFDHHLKGSGDAGCSSPVRLFVMGADRWQDETAWPPPSMVPTPWYLRAGGRFDPAAPTDDEPADSYRYDPSDPVPTRGGHVIGPLAGVADQREIEARADVLVYTSEPLEADLELTGPVRAVLHASSSATDTDFVGTLVDVRPDGYAHNLVEGIVRARLRESTTEPSLLEPRRTYAFEIDLWAVSHVVRAGHRIRVDVTSSSFPRWDRNPNTGAPFGADAELRPADQTIFHDRDHPSHVMLPVVRRS